MIKATYRTSATLAEATRKLVHHFFAEEGLVILDADHSSLKRHFIPQIKNDLSLHHCKESVEGTIHSIQENYSSEYTPQVNPREINLFYLKDDLRERLIKTARGYSTTESGIDFSKESLWKEVEDYPERFSPNVLLRPLYQEIILPNLCYIGGGGELAYWLQLKQFFKKERVPFPILLLRNSAVIVPQKTARKIERLQLEKDAMFLDRTALINKKIRQVSNIDLDLQFLKNKLIEQFDHLQTLVAQTDPSFKGTVAAQRQKQFNGIDALEKRLLNAQKKKTSGSCPEINPASRTSFPE